jgi:DNA repair exonuclease SbcCD ATPase subunit
LFGQALSNIRKDNLVNKTNGRAMLVGLDFEVGGRQYRIERGRKPNVLKFYVNQEEQTATDEAQGDSRETQDAIERVIGMSHDMFQHIVGLNTYTPAFLSLKANEQRTIIEQLLGITQLSDRADRIKELNRETKESISQEEMRIRAVQEANKRIEEQIDSLRKRQTLWLKKQQEDCETYAQAIADLEHIDIDIEVQAHRDLESYHQLKKSIDDCNKNHRLVSAEIVKLEKARTRLEQELAMLASHRCHACGQDIHDNQHETIRTAKLTDLAEINTAWQKNATNLLNMRTS